MRRPHDAHGSSSTGSTSPHTATGLRNSCAGWAGPGSSEVAIERPDGPVVDALLEAELTVFVIAPKQSKTCSAATGRPATRTTGSTPTCWPTCCAPTAPGCARYPRQRTATVTLRMTVRARQDLVHARVAMANQLRAHLQTTLPGVIGLFRDIDSAITLRFLTRFPSQDKADWLSRTRLGNWLRSVGYNHLANLDRLWDHLHGAPRGTTGPEGAARAEITLALVAALPASGPRSRPSTTRSPTSSPPTPTPRSSPPCPAPAPSAPPDCWPRSATPAAASPPPKP